MSNVKKKKNVNKANNKKVSRAWTVIGIVALCALIAVSIYMIRSRKAPTTDASAPLDVTDSLVIEQADESKIQEIAEETEKHENALEGFSEIAQTINSEDKKSDTEEGEEVSETSDESEESGSSGGGYWGGGSGSSGSGEIEASPSPSPAPASQSLTPAAVEPTPIPTIGFPYAITGTDLTILQVSPYSGYYLEDGSGDKIGNVTTIVVKNNGGDLSFAGIGIAQGDRNLAFSGSNIPAGATVIIQEQNREAYMDGNYYSATATTTESGGLGISSDALTIEDNGDNTFTVTNVSGDNIGSAVISYKSYLPDEDVYVGGITYTVNLQGLEPDAAIVVDSSHYVSGNSMIVSAVTD